MYTLVETCTAEHVGMSDMQVWLKQPLVDLAEITVRHDIVETFTSDPSLRESLRDQHLRGASAPTVHCTAHLQ